MCKFVKKLVGMCAWKNVLSPLPYCLPLIFVKPTLLSERISPLTYGETPPSCPNYVKVTAPFNLTCYL